MVCLIFQYQIGQKTIHAIRGRYGTDYIAGNIAETICTMEFISMIFLLQFLFLFHLFLLDLASGSSIDWVYAAQNVSLTYTFEFRDKGMQSLILWN